jgi:uncharacterized protein
VTGALGSVVTLNRFPVKSMQGEGLAAADLTRAGVVGDRAYALAERATGKVLSAKHPLLGTKLLACRAEFAGRLEAAEAAPVCITLPTGATVRSDDPEADAALSAYLDLPVRLCSSASDGYMMDVYHPDLADLGEEELRDTVTESTGGAAVFSQLGITSPIPSGSYLDAFPLSLLTTSTLATLESLAPDSRFDARRFRMNVVVETAGEGFVEQDWLGSTLELGDARIRVVIPDPRCVMTTLAQGDLPRDNGVLRTLARHNRLAVAGQLSPCAGVYAVIEAPGTVREGDRLRAP